MSTEPGQSQCKPHTSVQPSNPYTLLQSFTCTTLLSEYLPPSPPQYCFIFSPLHLAWLGSILLTVFLASFSTGLLAKVRVAAFQRPSTNSRKYFPSLTLLPLFASATQKGRREQNKTKQKPSHTQPRDKNISTQLRTSRITTPQLGACKS